MSKRNVFCVFFHAITMVGRTLRSYAMLSVTIILSFSLLLAYLFFVDATLYNEYKEVFARDRSVVVVQDSDLNTVKVSVLIEGAEELGRTHYTEMLRTNHLRIDMSGYSLESGESIWGEMPATVIVLAGTPWSVYDYSEELDITWLDGKERENICLKSGEILMDEQLFQAFGLSAENPYYPCKFRHFLDLYAEPFSGTFEVVGTIRSYEKLAVVEAGDANAVYISPSYVARLVFSIDDLNTQNAQAADWDRFLVFYSDYPERITGMAKELMMDAVDSVYDSQNAALDEIRAQKRTKAMIASVMLLILGLNLYSSFSNALNERKFEIGVKRAIGASKWAIVRQFLYEGMIVMAVDVFLSVVLVVDLGILYKLVREAVPDEFGIYENFVLYISPYSMAMFALCAVTLTVVFSLIFAYKSTQVQVVNYLKAE